jgi:hypothetical protein
MARAIGILPPRDVCQNCIGKGAAFGFRLRQFRDDSGNGLMEFIQLISVIAVVLDDKGGAYTCEYHNEFARQPAQPLTPALFLI